MGTHDADFRFQAAEVILGLLEVTIPVGAFPFSIRLSS
jgi:hypothetical protein